MTTIDLRSDTVTKPSDAMRRAAAEADVGDDVYRDDPTVNELERRAAEAVGKEAALYVPTGTMGNQIAVRVHADRGDELLVDADSHLYQAELGGVAQLCGVQCRTYRTGDRAADGRAADERGAPTPEQIEAGIAEQSLHSPGTGLVALENTHNHHGGVAIPRERVDAVAEAAHDRDVPFHVDGARIFNAAAALDTPAPELVESADSVMFCLSKGLGAPVGSVLAGPEQFIAEARRTRKLLGGGMRQAGVVAAPGLEALENVDRLEEDHANAQRLAEGLDALPGLDAPEPDTNIVLVHTRESGLTASQLAERCEEEGVQITVLGEYTARFVTHLGVERADVEEAVKRTERVVAERPV